MIRTIGGLPQNSKPIRAILLWSENCDFPITDRNLVRWAAQDFAGDVVLIINCDCLEHLDEIMPAEFLLHTVIIRKNIGYDWGGYRDLFLISETSSRPFVTILNNSVIPLFPFSAFLAEQEETAVEINGVVGAIESANPTRHLQSFCLTFSNVALNSKVIDWVKSTKNVSEKWAMVYFREIQLWRIVERNHISIRAILTNSQVRSFAKNNFDLVGEYRDSATYKLISKDLPSGSLNPTHHLWRFLLALGFPFIKKELVRVNPAKLPDLSRAESLISKASNV